jgi:hypothetical protein
VTLEWFVKNCWLPAKRAVWKRSTRENKENLITNHIIKPLGQDILESVDGSRLQVHVNSQASDGLSYSVIQHTVSFLKDIFDLAANDQYIRMSPANRLVIPRAVRPRIFSPEGGLDTGNSFSRCIN